MIRFEDPVPRQKVLQHLFSAGMIDQVRVAGVFFPDLLGVTGINQPILPQYGKAGIGKVKESESPLTWD